MPRYGEDFRRPSRAGRDRYHAGADPDYARRGELAYGDGGERGYGPEYYRDSRELSRHFRAMRPPMKPARGFPVHGYHSYDLDYGRQAGGPSTEYSGRAGYSEAPGAWAARGPYTPTLDETREAAGPYRPVYEQWHWSAAEPAWRFRGPHRGYARRFDIRRRRSGTWQ